MRHLDAALWAILIASPAFAQEFTLGDLTIGRPMAYETAPTAMAGGGYLTITNTGTAPDRLIGISSAFPRTARFASRSASTCMRRPLIG